MNSKLWLAIAVVVIIAVIGAFLAFQQQPPAQTTTPQTATVPIPRPQSPRAPST
jgi:hypothetical protein